MCLLPNATKSFLKPGDTSSEQYKTIKYLENLIEIPEHYKKTKALGRKTSDIRNCLCKEAISFEGVDAIFFGIGAQVCLFFLFFIFLFFFIFFLFFFRSTQAQKKLRSDSRALKHVCCLHGKDPVANRHITDAADAAEEETDYQVRI